MLHQKLMSRFSERNLSIPAQRPSNGEQLPGDLPTKPKNAPKNAPEIRNLPAQTREKPSLAAAKSSLIFIITENSEKLYVAMPTSPRAPRTFFVPQPIFSSAASFRANFPPPPTLYNSGRASILSCFSFTPWVRR
jgi:hypothetical protein